VAEGYRRYASSNPRAVLIDARGTPEEVERRVLACLAERLGGEFGPLAAGAPWS
jgi:thymidylate kinase